jgi:hypothetical protein
MRAVFAAAAVALLAGLPAPDAWAQSTGPGWHIGNGPQGDGSARAGAMSAASATTGPSTSGASVTMRDRLQAPGLGSYAAASGPCVGASTSGGLSLPGFGAQAGRTSIEDECQVREAARLLHSMGATEEALALLRSLPSVRKLAPPATVASAAAPPAPVALVAPIGAPAARPAWCDTASPADGARVLAACAR